MSNIVIVAIPEEDDYVWQVSSEKVPHCTLLFLGDTLSNPDATRIIDFVDHAVSVQALEPVMLSVDHRGLLGPDQADVVFFQEDSAAKRLADFRNILLQDNSIKKAYNSVEQYDGWTPHLTLGYPETPAKPDKRDYPGIRWVSFDRIAVWIGDYAGPEYRLRYNYDMAEVAMSTRADAGAAFLIHHGVKGMKWGVRRNRGAQSVRVTTRTSSFGKAKIKTKGGAHHPPHEDAIKVAEARQKLKRSGTVALSNHELQNVAKRMNLEQQVRDLQSREPSSATKEVLRTIANDPQARKLGQSAASAAGAHVLKKASKR